MEGWILLWVIALVSVVCCRPHTDNHCVVTEIELEEQFDLKKFSGIWYALAHYSPQTTAFDLTAGVFLFNISTDQTMQIQYGGERHGECIPPVTVNGWQYRGPELVVASHDQRQPLQRGRLWVVSTDYDHHALMYSCTRYHGDGTCDLDHVTAHVFGRSWHLEYAIRKDLDKLIDSRLCVDTNSLREIKHHKQCPPVSGISQTRKHIDLDEAPMQADDARTGGQEVSVDTRKKCYFARIPQAKRFSVRKFLGDWFILATHNNQGVIQAGHAHMEGRRDGAILSRFTGLGPDKECFPSVQGLLRLYADNKATFWAKYDTMEGPLRIIHVTEDYEFALTYHCHDQNSEGVCSDVTLDLIGRQTVFPEDLWSSLAKRLAEFCIDVDTVKRVSHDAYCPMVTDKRPNCEVKSFPAGQRVVWEKMSGIWHLTAASNTPLLNLSDVSAHLRQLPAGNVAVSMTGARDGVCVSPINGMFLIQDDGTVYVTGIFGKVKGFSKIVYTNYDVMLQYQCDFILDDGTCEPNSVVVLLWQRSLDYQISPSRFSTWLERMCVDPAALNPKPRQVDCEIRPFCRVDDIRAQLRFDMNMLVGEWHSILVEKRVHDLSHAHYLLRPNSLGGFSVYSAHVRNGVCGVTHRSSVLIPIKGRHGEFKVSYGRFEGILKLVYLSKNYALLYECDRERADGSCDPKQEHLEMLARSHIEVGQAFLQGAGPIIQLVCRTSDDMTVTTDRGECKLKRTPQMIPIDELPIQKNLLRSQMLGSWYQHATSEQSPRINSVKMDITDGENGALMLTMGGATNGYCLAAKTFVAIPTTIGSVGDWRFRFNRFPGRLRALYNNNQNMVLYFCSRLSVDGTCTDGHTTVTIASRAPTIKKKDLKVLHRHIWETGYNPDIMKPTRHQVTCDLQIKTSVCALNGIPAMRDLNAQQFYGVWYPIWRLTGSSTRNSAIIRLTDGHDETMIMEYGGSWKDTCVPTTRATVMSNGPNGGDLLINYGTTTGNLKVVYTDYRHALVYECGQQTPEGRCLTTEVNAEIWTRDGTIDTRLKFALLKRLLDLCVQPGLMEAVPREEYCALERVNSCKVGDVKSQLHLDLDKFVGAWFVIGSLKSTAGSWDSRRVTFTKTGDNTLDVQSFGAKQGNCLTPSHSLWKRIAGSGGIFKMDEDGMPAEIHVMMTDYDFAIIYECHHINNDGTCSPHATYIDVLSRTLGGVANDIRIKYNTLAQKLCLTEPEMTEIVHKDACDASLPSASCIVDNIIPDETFQHKWLPGEWRSLKHLAGSSRLDAILYNITAINKGFNIQFTSIRGSRCFTSVGLDPIMIGVGDNVGEYHIAYGTYRGVLKILYASSGVLAVYECYMRSKAGYCDARHTYTEILVRPGFENIPPDTMAVIQDRLRSACLDPVNLVDVTSEVTCGKKKIDPCLVENFPVVAGFGTQKMNGTWYSIARWGSHRRQDAMRADVQIISKSKKISIKYTGTIDGECQPSNTITYVSDSDGLWTSNIGSKATVVYLSANHMVMYECSHLVDNYCEQEFTYLDIYSRAITGPDASSQAAMTQVVISMCMAPEQFMQAQHAVSCPPTEPNLVHCGFDDIPAAKDFDVNKLTGTWYTLSRYSGSGKTHSESTRIVLVNKRQIQATFTASSRGACLPPRVVEATPYHNTGDLSDLLVHRGVGYGRIKIFYMDGSHLLWYECTELKADRSCDQGNIRVIVMGRTRRMPEEPIGVMQEMAEKTCFQRQDFELVSHQVECQLGPEATHCGSFSEIRVPINFNMELASGTWYFRYQSRGKISLTSGVIHLTGTAGAIQADLAVTQNGVCIPAVTLTLNQDAMNKAMFTSGLGVWKVLHLDAKYLIWYQCQFVSLDNECVAGNDRVSVMTRDQQPITDWDMKVIRLGLKVACLETGDMVAMETTEPCPLSKIGCSVDNLPIQNNLDLTKFTGTWFALSRLKYSRHYDSGTWIIQAGDDGYKVIVRGTLNGVCQPPGELKLSHYDGRSNGELKLVAAGSNVYVRVLYTDYEYALLYVCTQYTDGSCGPGADNIVVYSRTMSPSIQDLRRITQGVNTGCFDVNGMEWIPHEVDCEPTEPMPCLFSSLPVQQDLQPQKLSGMWYALFSLRGSSPWDSETMKFTVQSNGNIEITSTLASNGKCSGGQTSYLVRTDNPTVWTLHAGYNEASLRVLHLDNAFTVLYLCMSNDNRPACNHDDIMVIGLSRLRNLEMTEQSMSELTKVMSLACLQVGDLIFKKHLVFCGAQTNPVPSCHNISLIMSPMTDINYNKLPGVWYATYRLKGSLTSNSALMKIESLKNDSLLVHYSSSWHGGCMKTRSLTVEKSETSENQLQLMKHGMEMRKFIYIDDTYQTALSYGCQHLHDDGSCPVSMTTVTMWSRHKEVSWTTLRSLLANRGHECYSDRDFEKVPQINECDLVAMRPDESCRMSQVPAVDTADVHKILGGWFVRFVLKHDNYNSATVHFELTPEGAVKTYFSMYSEGSCHQYSATVQGAIEGGSMNYKIGLTDARTKIMYLDGDDLILYTCDLDDDLETCVTSSIRIVVYSRTLIPMVEDKRQVLNKLITDTCQQPGDLLDVSHQEICPVKVLEDLQCKVAHDTPTKGDFNMQKFLGTWHVLAALKGSSNLPGMTLKVTSKGQDMYDLTVTGARQDGCHVTAPGSLSLTEEHPHHMIILTPGGQKGDLHVLFSDEAHTVIHLCTLRQDDQTCTPGHTSILLLGRTTSMEHGLMEKLNSIVDQICTESGPFIDVSQSAGCKVPIVDNRHQCRVHNLPVMVNFNMDKFCGTWFSLYRLSRENMWDTSIIELEKSENNMYKMHYSGVNQRSCIATQSFEIVGPQDGRGAWMVNLKHAIMHSRVLYTDYQYAVYYYCMRIQDDGSCDPASAYLDVLGRSPQSPPSDVLDKLKQSVERACFQLPDLRPSDHTVSCERSSTFERDCRWKSLPVVHQFDVARFSGTWLPYAAYRVSQDYEAASFNFRESPDGSITLLMAASRGGKCLTPSRSVLSTGHHGDAEFILSEMAGQIRMRILYTDYQHAVVATCSGMDQDGTCRSEHLSVYIYTRGGSPTEAALHDIKVTATAACQDVEELMVTRATDCPVRQLSCDPEEVVQQHDFSLIRFLGNWYPVARLRNSVTITTSIMRLQSELGGSISAFLTGSIDGQCLPTTRLDVQPVGDHSADIRLIRGVQRVRIRVMSTDYRSYAVVMICTETDDTLTCDTGTDTVMVISRTVTMTDSYLDNVLEEVGANCFHGDDLEWTSEDGCVPSFETSDQCQLNNIPAADNIQISEMSGMWYSLAEVQPSPGRWQSVVTEMEALSDGKILMTTAGAREGLCLSQSEVTLEPTDRPGEWSLYKPPNHKGILKVLYSSPEYLAIYRCDVVTDNNTCSPGGVYAAMLGRSRDQVNYNDVASIYAQVDQHCFMVGDIVRTSLEDACEILPETPLPCNSSVLPEHHNLNLDRFSGTWYGIYQLRSNKIVTDQKSQVHSSSTESTLSIEMVSSSEQECSPVLSVVMVIDDPTVTRSVMYMDMGPAKFQLQVIWTDYEYFVGSMCMDTQTDGSCPPEALSIQMMSRHPEPTEGSTVLLEQALNETCFGVDDFVAIQHNVDCDIGLKSEQCRLNNLPTPADLDINKISGSWYALYITRGAAFWDSGIVSLTPSDGGSLKVLCAFARGAECMRKSFIVKPDAETPASWSYHTGQFTAQMRIIHVSEDYMVLYKCSKILARESCDPDHVTVVVLGRSHDDEDDDDVLRMIHEDVRAACVEPGDLIHTKIHADSCQVSEPGDLPCEPSQLEILADMDINRITGSWFAVAKLRGTDVMDSGVMHIAQYHHGDKYHHHEDGHDNKPTNYYHQGQHFMHIKVTGSKRERCLHNPIAGILSYHDNPANMTMSFGSNKGNLHILYTDYLRSMLTYECYRRLENGLCAKGQETVILYSRTYELTHDAETQLHAALDTACTGRKDFELVPHTVICQLDVQTDVSCRPRNLPSVPHFDMKKFLGTWYSVYRLRADHTYKSMTVKYELTPPGDVIVYYTGSRDEECTETRSLQIRQPDTPGRSVFITEEGDTIGELRVLYSDYKYTVMYSCYGMLQDGRCSPNKTYVDVLSRHRNPPPANVTMVMRDVLNKACYQLGDLDPVRKYDYCEFSHKESEQCKIEDMPVVMNFDPDRFTGSWYSYAQFKESSSLDSNSLYVMNNGGHLEVISRGQRYGECLSPITYILEPTEDSKTADYRTRSTTESTARVRVLYTDYNNALVATCSHQSHDRSCSPGHGTVIMYTRADLTADSVRSLMVQAASSPCLSEHDFVPMRTEGERCEARRVHCDGRDLPAQKDLNLNKMSGTWYQVAGLRGAGEEQSGVLRLYADNSRYMAALTGHSNGSCEETLVTQITRYLSGETADLYLVHQHKTVLHLRVLHTDYERFALVYACNSLQVDHTCAHGYDLVYAYSRTKHISESDLRDLVGRVQGQCFTENEFTLVSQGECMLKLPPPTHCALDELPIQEDLTDNIFMITGSWYLRYTRRDMAENSKSYHLDIQELQDDTLKIRSVHASGSVCRRTIFAVLQQTNTPGQYMAGLGNKRALFRFTTVDEHLLVHKCLDTNLDGQCASDLATMDIYSRGVGKITPESLTQLRHRVRQACFEPGDFGTVNHDVWCSLAFYPPIDCNMEQLTTAGDINMNMLSGTWYARYTMAGSNVPDSALMRFAQNADGSFTAYMTGVMRGWPGSTAVATFEHDGESPDLYIDAGGAHRGHMKIVYLADASLMIYMCPRENDQGVCVTDGASMIIYHRSLRPLDDLLQQIVSKVKSACITLEDFNVVAQDVPAKLDIDLHEMCTVNNISTVDRLDISKLVGKWYIMYSMRGGQYTEIDLETYNKDHLKAQFVGHHDHQCVQRSAIFHRIPHKAELVVSTGHYKAVIKVITLSETHTMLYTCHQVAAEGHCAEGHSNLEILSRSPDDLRIHDTEELISGLQQACVQAGDLTPTDRSSKHTVSCSGVDDPASCDRNGLRTQQEFNPTAFTGTWYGLMRYGSSSTLQSITMRVAQKDEKTLGITSVASRSGWCLSVSHGRLTIPISGYKGDMYATFGSVRGHVRVLWTDYTYALVFECYSETREGTCEAHQGDLYVYSRSSQTEPPDIILQKMQQSCLVMTEFTPLSHNVSCPLDDATPPKCLVRNIPYESNFDMNKYLGTWYSLYRQRGGHVLSNFIAHYHNNLDGKVKAIYTGVSQSNGTCVTLQSSDIKPATDGSTTWQDSNNGGASTVKILYTDYRDYSVVYTCTSIHDDGSCDPGHQFLDILGRERHEPSQEVKNKLIRVVMAACILPGDLLETYYDLECAVSGGTEQPCDYAQLPGLNDPFDHTQFEGIWHSYARIHGSSTSDAMSMVTRLDSRGGYNLIFYTQRNGRCLRRRSTIITPCDKNKPRVFCTPGGGRFVIYVEGDLVLTLTCLRLEPDTSSCRPGLGAMYLMSRHADRVDSGSLRKLLAVVDETCMSRDDAVLTPHHVTCDTRRVQCSARELPPQKHLDMRRFTGSWTISAVNRPLQVWTTSPLIRIQQTDAQMYKLHLLRPMHEDQPSWSVQPILHTLVPIDIYNNDFIMTRVGTNITQYWRILWTDYDRALVYNCQLDESRSCVPGSDMASVFSRSHDLTENDLNNILSKVKDKRCFSAEEFNWMPPSLPSPIPDTDQSQSCTINTLPYQRNLNIKQITGLWHVIYRGRNTPDWSSPVVKYTLKEAGNIQHVSTGAIDGECLSTSELEYHKTDVPYQWRIHTTTLSKVFVQVLYVDEDMMLMYKCMLTNNDDTTCRPGSDFIDVLGRSSEELSGLGHDIMIDVIQQACHEPGDYIYVSNEAGCELLEYQPFSCDIDNLPAQSDIVAEKFTGHWNAIYRTHGTRFGDSSKIKFKANGNGTYTILTIGTRRGHCMETSSTLYSQKLVTDGPSGNLYGESNTHKSRVRILYTDYTYALVYTCKVLVGDDRCLPGASIVTAFSRTDDIPGDTISHMRALLDKECPADEDYFEHLLVEDVCKVTEPNLRECYLNNIPVVSNFDLQKFVGRWYGRFQLKSTATWESYEIFLRISGNQQLHMTHSYYNGTSCHQVTDLFLQGGAPGVFYSRLGKHKGMLRVSHTDYRQYAMMYGCDMLVTSGPCPDDHRYVTFYSRTLTDIPVAHLAHLRHAAWAVCTEPGDYMEIKQQESCHPLPARSLRCSRQDMPQQQDLSMERFTGLWYGVARSVGSAVPDSWRFSLEQSDDMEGKFQITGQVSGRCVPPQEKSTITVDGEELIFPESGGRARVLYTDYDIALLYVCKSMLDPETCAPGHDSLVAYSRTLDLKGDIRDILETRVEQTCYRKTDMELISHQTPCHFPVPNACLVRNMPSESNFIMDKFLGTWYGLYHLRGSHVMDGFVLHITQGVDRVIRLYHTGALKHECQKLRVREMPETEAGSSSWVYDWDNNKGVFKVVYTDYYYAMVYLCDNLLDDGTCNHGDEFVHIMSRHRSFPSVSLKQKLTMHAKQICKQSGEFVTDDLTLRCSLSTKESKKCHLDDMPIVNNFDATKFEGVWYSYAKLRTISHYDSAVSVIRRGPNGALMILNHHVSNGKCIDPFEKTLLPSGVPNVADFRQNGGRVRILYTDYGSALLVGCYQIEADGQCTSGQEIAIILSRTPTIPIHQRKLIASAAREACIDESQLRSTIHNVECPLSYSGRRSCRVDDVVTQEDFALSKMYGTWHLLADTQTSSEKSPMTIRYMLGHGNKIRYTLARPHSDGSCFTSIAYATPDQVNPATYHEEYGFEKALHKIIYITSSYRVVYTCDGSAMDEQGACPLDRQYLQVWGRSSFVTESIIEELMNTVKHRTCLSTEDFTMIPAPDVFCRLPLETCSMYKFVEQEEFDPTTLYGGWQLLARTTLRHVQTVSRSLLYYPGQDKQLQFATAGSLSTGDCYQKNGVHLHQANHKATYNATIDAKSVLLRILHVTKDHLITMSCIGGLDEHGVCFYGNSELHIYGKTFDLDDEKRKQLIQIAQERTLGCVPTLAMMDVPANDNCQMGLEYCSSEHFQIPDEFDQRMMYGHWNRVMRTTFSAYDLVSTRIRYGHGDNNHLDYRTGSLTSHGYCEKGTGVANLTRDQLATYYMVNMDNSRHNFKVLYVSSSHLVLFKCVGGWDEAQRCPLVRTLIDVLARDQELTATSVNKLQLIVRQRTLSCVPTSMFVTVRPTECEVDPPKGRESCRLDDIREVDNLSPKMLEGVWYQIARSDYKSDRLESRLDGVTLSVKAGDGTITYTGTGHVSGHPKKCLPATDRVLVYGENAALQTYEHAKLPGVKSVLKVLHLDADYLISYQCFNHTQTSEGLCPHHNEDVALYARRRNINQVDRQRLASVLMKNACVARTDIVLSNHTGVCKLETDSGLDVKDSCLVDELPIQKNFQQNQFMGVWYEVERTRFTEDNIWESIVTHFNPTEKFFMRLTVSGTRSGQCMGPFEAHVRPASGRAVALGDMYMWIGSQDSYGHPWTLRMRYKVIFTDYLTSIVYTCRHVNADGTCPRRAQQIDILSRHRDLDPETRSWLYDIIKDTLCVSPEDFVVPAHEADCLQFVQPASDMPEELEMGPLPHRQCPEVLCSRFCEHGLVRDELGCETCDCREGPVDYRPEVVEGDRQGARPGGDEAVFPDPLMCTVPMCETYCKDGYLRDNRGCETCSCVPPNNDVPEKQTGEEPYPAQCAIPMCSAKCKHGYVHNAQGCMTCQCKESPPSHNEPPPLSIPEKESGEEPYPAQCAIPMCSDDCEEYVHNAQGCMTCQCKELPPSHNAPPPLLELDLLCRPTQCTLSCVHGFMRDPYGCDICKCADQTDQSEAMNVVGVADDSAMSVLEEVGAVLQKLGRYFF